MLINGMSGDAISAHNRGLFYGDDVFRIPRVRGGIPRGLPQRSR